MARSELAAVLSTTILAIAALGTGGWIWRRLPSTFSWVDRLACTWLGGLGVLGILLFLVGQLAFTRTCILLVLGVGIAAAIFFLARRGNMRCVFSIPETKIPALPAMAIAAVLIVTALGGLSEPVGDWGNDAIAYHLLGPKVWLRNGVVRPVLDNCHTAFPATTEILYGAVMAFGGERAPGFFALLTFALFLLVTGSLATRSGLGSRGAWWAAALVAAMPAVYTGAHSGFVDVVYAGFVLAAARIGFDAESTREYIAMGLFCGLGMATKYTGLLALPAVVLCSTLPRLNGKRGSLGLAAKVGIPTAVASVIAAPFYVRNWILLGCPIYPPTPALAHQFHVKYLSLGAVNGYYAYILKRGEGLGHGLGAYLLLPFNLTYHTSNFHGAGGVGLAPLALGPLGLVASRQNGFVRALALLALILTTTWFVTDQESRFLIHVYVIGAVLAVMGWRYGASLAPRFSPILAAAVVACSLLYGLFMIGSARADDIHAALSSSFAAQRRREQIPFLDSFEYLNRNASARSVLILDASVPPYYCDKNYVKPFGQWGERPLPDAPDLSHVLAQIRCLHVTHILDVDSGYSPFQLMNLPRDLTLVFERSNQRIYRVSPQ